MTSGRPRAGGNRVTDPAARLAQQAARLRGDLVDVPPLTAASSAGDAVTLALTEDVRRLLDGIGTLPTSDDVEALHQARVASRRLRTDLRTFRPLIDPDTVAALEPELAWLGRVIGAVRDHDVFVEILADRARDLVAEPALVSLADRFRAGRAALVADLGTALGSDRALGALTGLTTLAIDPPLVALVDEPAAEVLTALARKPWRKLERAARSLDADSPIGELHGLRIRVKKARYAVAAAALVRPEAGPHVRALARVQMTLGDINDAALTIHQLQVAVEDDLDAELAYAAGVVVTMERRRIEERRVEWPGRWDQARRKRVRAWLDSSD